METQKTDYKEIKTNTEFAEAYKTALSKFFDKHDILSNFKEIDISTRKFNQVFPLLGLNDFKDPNGSLEAKFKLYDKHKNCIEGMIDDNGNIHIDKTHDKMLGGWNHQTKKSNRIDDTTLYSVILQGYTELLRINSMPRDKLNFTPLPGGVEDIIREYRDGTHPQREKGNFLEKISYLDSLKPLEWHKGYFENEKQANYWVAVFPNPEDPQNDVIAVAEAPERDNAAYYIRSNNWKDTMRIDKPTARKMGSKRIYHDNKDNWKNRIKKILGK